MRRSIPAILMASTLVAGLSAQAQTPAAEAFADYDPSGAGRVSLAEWQAHDWRVALERYDRNQDGRLTKDEFVSAYCARIEADLGRTVARCPRDIALWFAALDRNHDGELSRREYDALSGNLFRQNDRNHDGYVTQTEMQETAGGK